MAKKARRVFGFSDIHWVYRHEEALEVAKRAHKAFKPDWTCIGGDLFSYDAFSSYAPRSMRDVQETSCDWETYEKEPVIEFVDWVQQNTKDKTIYIEGNHEQRIDRWAANSGPAGNALYSMLSPRKFLRKGRKQFSYVNYSEDFEKSYAKLHKNLVVIHGWTTAKHAAAKTLDHAKSKSVLFHHTHRIQSDTRRDPFTGDTITAKSSGCLCKFQPMYCANKPTEWAHGFWVAFIGSNSHTFYVVEIKKGKAVMPDGTEVKV